MKSFTIGIIGHRKVNNPLSTKAAIDSVVGQVVKSLASSDTDRIIFLSSLAEGFDRLVVLWSEQILSSLCTEINTSLHAVLPLSAEEYTEDFSGESKQEFFSLLGRADKVVVFDKLKRPYAYLMAGQYVVKNSDLLLCVWDGKPTSEIAGTFKALQASVGQGLKVVWVHSETGEITYGHSGGVG